MSHIQLIYNLHMTVFLFLDKTILVFIVIMSFLYLLSCLKDIKFSLSCEIYKTSLIFVINGGLSFLEYKNLIFTITLARK